MSAPPLNVTLRPAVKLSVLPATPVPVTLPATERLPPEPTAIPAFPENDDTPMLVDPATVRNVLRVPLNAADARSLFDALVSVTSPNVVPPTKVMFLLPKLSAGPLCTTL